MRSAKYSWLPMMLLWVLISTSAAMAQKKDTGRNLPAPPPPTPYSDVKRDSMLNGMQIISLERSGDQKVKCYLIIRTGSIFDLTGKTGLAKLTLDTLLAVNPRLKDEIESLQGSIEWGVSRDTTWFNIEIPPANFDTGMEILGRLLVVESIRPDAFKAAQAALISEIRNQKPTQAERADESFFKALYGDHPYGHNLNGNEQTISGIKQGDVYDFMRRFYMANNASVVVAGNITHERVMRTFKVLWGGWAKGQIIQATFRSPAQNTQLRVIKVEQADAANVEIRGGVVGLKITDPDFLVTELMARILQARLGGEAGEVTVRSWPQILPGPLAFSASVPADRAPELSRKMTESFAALATNSIAGEELAAAKSYLIGQYASLPVELNLRNIEIYSLPRNFPLNVATKIEAVTSADIQRVAKKLLDANALTLLVSGKVSESFK